MKSLPIYLLAVAALFAGCTKKTNNLFDTTADERLSDALGKYQAALTAAPGWKLFVYPKGLDKMAIKVGGLSYYLKFTNTNRVTMVADFNTTQAATPKESGYHLKALQRPSLIFDTYTYMHIAADPDANVSFSPANSNGYGWGTDFNFAFTSLAIKDTIPLQGNFNKSEAVLIKATQAEMDAAFTKGRLRDIINFSNAYVAANPYLFLRASPSLNVGVGFDFYNVIISFTYLEGSVLVNKSFPFSFTTNGIYLQSPVTIGNYTFQEIFWDDVKKVYYILSGTTRVEFSSAAAPVITISLANVIGNQYTTISVPPGAGLPNESPLFISRYNLARSGMLSGPYGLTLNDLDFVFNAGAKTMIVNAYVFQGAVGPYLCQYVYTYAIDGTGSYKFTYNSQNNNGALIAANMSNILSFFNTDTFKMDGFSTSSAFLGQFTSRQNAAFYFTGYLY